MKWHRLFLVSLTMSTGLAAPFTFDDVRLLARERAESPYLEHKDNLDAFWKNLTYDQHREIRFKMAEGLWAKEKLPFTIDFFHPGWTAKKTVTVNEVIDGREKPVDFDQDMFDYGKTEVPKDTPPPPGYAGWRARFHLNSPDRMDEFWVNLGASYFRSIPAGAPYGLSARGLSINSGLQGVPEEFPDFQKFWLVRPAADAKELTAYALMDGPSVAGAWKFTCRVAFKEGRFVALKERQVFQSSFLPMCSSSLGCCFLSGGRMRMLVDPLVCWQCTSRVRGAAATL